ncbi:ricin-type beta-trefoil lectin domain protein [Micromonosporaceae bacterium B7E4]
MAFPAHHPRGRTRLLAGASGLLLVLFALVGPAGADSRSAPAAGPPPADHQHPPGTAADHHHPPGTAAHGHGPVGPAARPLSGVPADDPARGLVYGGLVAARSGPCVGAYQVAGIVPTMCTHGPDSPPAGLSVDREIQPISPRAARLAPRALPVCEGDGVSGRRVEVLYVHGSVNRYAQYLETFRTLAESVDAIFYESARETGGSRRVRYVTETVNGACRPVVRDVQIPDAALNANDWAPLLNAVRAAGYTRTDRKYLQFVDARVYCGIGGFAGDTRKTDQNRSNSGPEYARADSGCWNAGVAAHELGHTLGAVNNNAPNASGYAHCVDEWDVMCYKDNASTVIQTRCTDRAHDQRLDCNHDDYYHTAPAAGSYLATYYNVADNLFLIRNAAAPAPAPTTFRMVNGASGGCLDVPDGASGAVQPVLGTCGGGADQSVRQVGETLRVRGRCLDASGPGTAAGTAVLLSGCDGGAGQRWSLRPDGSVSGISGSRCLATTPRPGGMTLVLADCTGQPAQQWSRG